MRADTRRKLDVGMRVQNMVRPFAEEDRSYRKLFGELVERLSRAQAMSLQQLEGRQERRGAVAQCRALRKRLHQKLLPHLVQVGKRLGETHPELDGLFRPPLTTTPYLVFVTHVRGMLSEAQAHREEFLAAGLAEPLLDELAQELAELERANQRANLSRLAHIGASAELKWVAGQVMTLVGELDSLTHYKYAENPEVLAAWESMRKLGTPSRAKRNGGPPSSSEHSQQ
jgi:hypothetical protein